jgi:hypothetical protein
MDGERELLEEAIALWRESDTSFPRVARQFTLREQAVCEGQLVEFLGTIEAELTRLPRTRPERDRVRERITLAFIRFAKSAIGMEDRHLELLLDGGFSGVGTSLARQARRFDPSVSVTDILQACRNAWTACGLQVLLGHPMRVTPSIFAYSMLYPYSDNYLDDPHVSRDEKAGFNRRFGRRLSGERIDPAGVHEENVWRLITLIEGQYPRPSYPRVFASLLAIHRAQVDSLHLARRSAAAGEVDVLKLSFAKGGASVLADGYLAGGSLTADEARFIFFWGVLLQLGDDLQDVRDDRAGGVLTLFSQSAGSEPLDSTTNRAFHFGERVMRLLDGVGAAASRTLRELIRRSSRSFFIRSAGEASEFYTKEYLARLEAHSPFRFSFLDQSRKRFARRQAAFTRLFEAFLASEEDEPAFPLLPNALMPRF